MDEEVFGVKLAQVDGERLAACARDLGLEVPNNARVEELVEVLASHFTTEHKAGVAMLECDRCAGVAPEAMDVCPFCGEPSGGSSEEDEPTAGVDDALAVAEPAPMAQLSVETACALLAGAREVDEVRQIRDVAVAMAAYARASRAGKQAQVDAAEIVLRADRRWGELDAQIVHPTGGKGGTVRARSDVSDRVSAHRKREAAKLPEEDFEAYAKASRQAETPATIAGAVKLAKLPASERKQAIAEARKPKSGKPAKKVALSAVERKLHEAKLAAAIVARVLRSVDVDALYTGGSKTGAIVPRDVFGAAHDELARILAFTCAPGKPAARPIVEVKANAKPSTKKPPKTAKGKRGP